jgi:hypothetical protein
MPTVLRFGAYRFFFFSNEGREAPHIHVAHAGKEAKFWLDPVGVARNNGFAPHEIREARTIIVSRIDAFKEAWNDRLTGD